MIRPRRPTGWYPSNLGPTFDKTSDSDRFQPTVTAPNSDLGLGLFGVVLPVVKRIYLCRSQRRAKIQFSPES